MINIIQIGKKIIFYNDIYNFDNYYKLKLNDFGYSTSNWKSIIGLTKFYADYRIIKELKNTNFIYKD